MTGIPERGLRTDPAGAAAVPPPASTVPPPPGWYEPTVDADDVAVMLASYFPGEHLADLRAGAHARAVMRLDTTGPWTELVDILDRAIAHTNRCALDVPAPAPSRPRQIVLDTTGVDVSRPFRVHAQPGGLGPALDVYLIATGDRVNVIPPATGFRIVDEHVPDDGLVYAAPAADEPPC